MTAKSFLVTGGTGFLGSSLVRRLVSDGHRVRVFDNNSRGSSTRLQSIAAEIEWVEGDVRDADAVRRACARIDNVCHLAYVNGTEFFYTKPDLVLEVGVAGMMNVINGCLAEEVGELVLASSSEVYQSPPVVPTDETAPLSVPDPLNPRYSYGGGKIISELLAINYGRERFERVVIFRPHNVYGPDMGNEHVIPQFATRMATLFAEREGTVPFPIQGSGRETRAFVYIDDLISGVIAMIERGSHLGIYHVGTEEEITIRELATRVAACFGREIDILPGELTLGSTPRRCPDISKLRALGYEPSISLEEGLMRTVSWYAASPTLTTT